MKARKPWRPLEEETAKAYKAFCAYLELGEERSLERAVEALGKVPGYVCQLKRWSGRYQWVVRVEAWDKTQLDMRLQVKERALSRAQKRYADALEGLSVVVLQLATDRLTTADGKAGREVPPSVQLRAAIHAQTMAGLLPPPQRVEMTGKDGTPLMLVEEVEAKQRNLSLLHQDPEAAEAVKALAFRSAVLALQEDPQNEPN